MTRDNKGLSRLSLFIHVLAWTRVDGLSSLILGGIAMGQGRIVLRLVGSGLVMPGRCGIWCPVWLVGLGEGTAHTLE